MSADAVSISDLVSLGVGLLGFISAIAARKTQLPSWARKWLKRIGSRSVIDAIERAGAIIELTPDQRRKQAVIYLQKLSVKKLGFPIPASIANLLVEHLYQQRKRLR